MKIHVDFFKNTGKWYSGGEVEIGDARLWHGQPFLQAIVDGQDQLVDSWPGDFYVVTRDLPGLEDLPSYTDFSYALFAPHRFDGMTRTKPE